MEVAFARLHLPWENANLDLNVNVTKTFKMLLANVLTKVRELNNTQSQFFLFNLVAQAACWAARAGR